MQDIRWILKANCFITIVERLELAKAGVVEHPYAKRKVKSNDKLATLVNTDPLIAL